MNIFTFSELHTDRSNLKSKIAMVISIENGDFTFKIQFYFFSLTSEIVISCDIFFTNKIPSTLIYCVLVIKVE